MLLINAFADVTTSAQTAACSKRCVFVMIVLYAINYSRDRPGAAAANERFNSRPWSTDVVILNGISNDLCIGAPSPAMSS